jgi:tRNA dimethylallyltransferase
MMAKTPGAEEQDVSAVLIAGPTASGKSALALAIAQDLGGEIVNADSMQVYGVLDRLTARPAAEDLGGAASSLWPCAAADGLFHRHLAEQEAEDHSRHQGARGAVPVVVGGTGLYFRALTGGLSDMPAIPDAIREELRARLETRGVEALHAELARLDPLMAEAAAPGRPPAHIARAGSGDGDRPARLPSFRAAAAP